MARPPPVSFRFVVLVSGRTCTRLRYRRWTSVAGRLCPRKRATKHRVRRVQAVCTPCVRRSRGGGSRHPLPWAAPGRCHLSVALRREFTRSTDQYGCPQSSGCLFGRGGVGPGAWHVCYSTILYYTVLTCTSTFVRVRTAGVWPTYYADAPAIANSWRMGGDIERPMQPSWAKILRLIDSEVRLSLYFIPPHPALPRPCPPGNHPFFFFLVGVCVPRTQRL